MTNINESTTHIGQGLTPQDLRGNSEEQDFDVDQILDSALNHVVDSSFDLIHKQRGEFTIFAPKGRVNNATIKHLKGRLYQAADEPGCKIILNLRYVDSIDSVGLGVLITAHKNAVARGGMVVFTDMNDRIFKTMKMLYMDRFLNMESTMKRAIELMS
ncbi:STAS domain-containing protein [Maridesulfovibrio hydrothermalis]|uniref:Anti-sigma-factor antagonist n=1 Tax=Maridesulfovibrio hydrothermalis AM13 = DSM 14728 TaxID=1121451 RepID=L0R5U5_9BACT|nr:STAS domain-containing protein [Maridesulfovibrio hydrothermalis]CCO22058.1 Anti-sigma-factor antagonist [Maridesulfovibrio hydrothermalis AM13 = DSM 14728]